MQQHRLSRRLRDLNPINDVPDKDSAKNPEIKVNLSLLTRAILGKQKHWPEGLTALGAAVSCEQLGAASP